MKEKVVFKEKKKPLSASDKVFNVFNYLLFGLLTLICLYPFYYLIINTISANDLSANGLITLMKKLLNVPCKKLQAGTSAFRYFYCGADLRGKNRAGNRTYRTGKCVPWVHVYAGKNVGKKLLVSCNCNHHVF